MRPLSHDLQGYLGLPQLWALLYVVVPIYLVVLFRRLVKAVERVADHLEDVGASTRGAQR